VRKGLAKRREERWTTAGEYMAAIDQVQTLLTDPTYEGLRAPSPTNDSITPAPTRALDARSAASSGPLLLANRRRKSGPSLHVLAGLALLAAAALGIVIAVLLRDPKSSRASSRPDPTTPAGLAAALLERGKAADAVKAIESAKGSDKDAEAQLQLGHAYQAQRKNSEAVAAYRRTVELDPSKVSNGDMRSALRAISLDTDVDAAMQALALRVKLDDGEARKSIIQLAGGADAARRKPAAAIAEKLGLSHEVDWLASYLYDLEQRDVCAQRKEAVTKLRALGDKRAIPALEQAQFRKGRVGKWKGKNVNECLVDDAKAAITFLQGTTP
jgi:tetratricopeptide (TPR) repeat protein